MKLIDKDALVAEIEKKKEKYWKRGEESDALQDGNAKYWGGVLSCLSEVTTLINTLGVREVDLEKEIDNYISNNFFGSQTMGFFANRTKEEPNDEDIAIVAKHFFELGLKAQHDNWKVVDNINPPQADRNKIYCVFTKQHYILAKVINHPQDEDLLQWKCTEFPHYRYDMCEGDKYMQIV